MASWQIGHWTIPDPDPGSSTSGIDPDPDPDPVVDGPRL
jgi:hypothetical protein